MRKAAIIIYGLILNCVLHQSANGQNTTPYWSAAGNSNATSSSKLGTTNGINLRLYTNNAERIRITTSGLVGIGTTSPVQKLDVAGNINLAKGYGLYMENRRVLRIDSALQSVFLGNNAGVKNTGFSNIGSGSYALNTNTTGAYNAALGAYALYSNTDGGHNVAIGSHSLYSNTTGAFNIATGGNALRSNTTGQYNTATGRNALFGNTTGNFNTAMGGSALYSNTTGTYNTASGYHALNQNTEGRNNVALGSYVMGSNKTGSSNLAAGDLALSGNTTGSYNVALGEHALFSSTSGDQNTVVGAYAMDGTNGASGNTAVGFKAGMSQRHGWNNTFVGPRATNIYGDCYNSIAIGNAAFILYSNEVAIGNPYITRIGGYAGWSVFSDGRIKRAVQENVAGLAFINKLRPVTYNYDLDAAEKINGVATAKDKDGKPLLQPLTQMDLAARKAKQQIVYTGFIAQEVEKAAKELKYNFSGVDVPNHDRDLYSLRYSEFVMPLVKAVQELSKKDEELEKKTAEIGELRNDLAELRRMLQALTNGTMREVASPSATLGQNTPNPATTITRITYTLGKASKQAHLMLTDGAGKMVKTVPLTTSGVVNINTSSLSSGVYNYSLIIDGKTVETKRLTVTR